MVDDAYGVHEEIRRHKHGEFGSGRHDRHSVACRARPSAHDPVRRRAWKPRAGRLDDCACALVDVLGCVSRNRKRQADVAARREAELSAGKPAGIGGQAKLAAGDEVTRGRHVHEVDHLSDIAVRHQWRFRHQRWRRKLYEPGLRAGRRIACKRAQHGEVGMSAAREYQTASGPNRLLGQ